MVLNHTSARGAPFGALVPDHSVFFSSNHVIWGRFSDFTVLEKFKIRDFDFKMPYFRAFFLFLILFGSKKDFVTHVSPNLDLAEQEEMKKLRKIGFY